MDVNQRLILSYNYSDIVLCCLFKKNLLHILKFCKNAEKFMFILISICSCLYR